MEKSKKTFDKSKLLKKSSSETYVAYNQDDYGDFEKELKKKKNK